MTVRVKLPRYVKAKRLATGGTGFYWEPPTRDRKRAERDDLVFPFESCPLGIDLGQTELERAAQGYNDQLDEWRKERRSPETVKTLGAYGSVKWLIETYLRSEQFKEKVSEVSRPDYRRVLDKVCALQTERSRTVGDLAVYSISPRAADKIYARMIEGEKYRRGEKAVVYCKRAWAVIGRLYPDVLPKGAANPWVGITLKKRTKNVKSAVDRETVYRFAEAAIANGRPECAAAAVICFEWLQRPMNVVMGGFRWTDYDPPENRGWVQIEHHKTGQTGWHPLVGDDPDTGETVRFYPEAEAILAQVPRRGVAVVLGPDGQPYKPTRFAQIVRKVAAEAGIDGFSLDACRHGGMTELEEAGLTEGQGRALSMHRTSAAYRGYAKQTKMRAVGATLKRFAHRRANAQ